MRLPLPSQLKDLLCRNQSNDDQRRDIGHIAGVHEQQSGDTGQYTEDNIDIRQHKSGEAHIQDINSTETGQHRNDTAEKRRAQEENTGVKHKHPRDNKGRNTQAAAQDAGFAETAGLVKQGDDEFFDLTSFTQEKKKELVEFRLRFNKKGYTNFCRYCNGFLQLTQIG